jgi:ABC-type uncharacterized transport system YnjBCD permease subunit
MTVLAVTTIRDKSKLEKWGEVRSVNQRYCYPDELEGGRLPKIFMRELEKAAEAFNPNEDLVAIVGDQGQLAQLLGLLARRHGSIGILRYDKFKDDYFKVII